MNSQGLVSGPRILTIKQSAWTLTLAVGFRAPWHLKFPRWHMPHGRVTAYGQPTPGSQVSQAGVSILVSVL